MKNTDLQASIRRAAWPEPSPELRARVLQNSALIEHSLARTDRIWFSRGWRLSLAAATVCVFLLGYISSPQTLDGQPTLSEMARLAAVEETIQDAGLPPDEAAMFARRTLVDSRSAAWFMYPSTSLQIFETFEMSGGRR